MDIFVLTLSVCQVILFYLVDFNLSTRNQTGPTSNTLQTYNA